MNPSPVSRLFDEQPLHPEAARSPLAARYYVDPDIFEAETEAIFYRSWQFAAHRSQLDAPGKFVTTRIHDQELFFIWSTWQGGSAIRNRTDAPICVPTARSGPSDWNARRLARRNR